MVVMSRGGNLATEHWCVQLFSQKMLCYNIKSFGRGYGSQAQYVTKRQKVSYVQGVWSKYTAKQQLQASAFHHCLSNYNKLSTLPHAGVHIQFRQSNIRIMHDTVTYLHMYKIYVREVCTCDVLAWPHKSRKMDLTSYDSLVSCQKYALIHYSTYANDLPCC